MCAQVVISQKPQTHYESHTTTTTKNPIYFILNKQWTSLFNKLNEVFFLIYLVDLHVRAHQCWLHIYCYYNIYFLLPLFLLPLRLNYIIKTFFLYILCFGNEYVCDWEREREKSAHCTVYMKMIDWVSEWVREKEKPRNMGFQSNFARYLNFFDEWIIGVWLFWVLLMTSLYGSFWFFSRLQSIFFSYRFYYSK